MSYNESLGSWEAEEAEKGEIFMALFLTKIQQVRKHTKKQTNKQKRYVIQQKGDC